LFYVFRKYDSRSLFSRSLLSTNHHFRGGRVAGGVADGEGVRAGFERPARGVVSLTRPERRAVNEPRERGSGAAGGAKRQRLELATQRRVEEVDGAGEGLDDTERGRRGGSSGAGIHGPSQNRARRRSRVEQPGRARPRAIFLRPDGDDA